MRARIAAVGLLLAASLLYLPGLGATHLWDVDEAIFGACAAEMWDAGEWVAPTYNGSMFGHKPALVYWQMMAGFAVWGVGEWAARLPSALWSLATLALTLRIGRRLFDESTARWAVAALATSLLFALIARAATIDATLVFFITAAMDRFVAWRFPQGEQEPARRIPLGEALGLYAALGMAFLAKGPIGVVLPAAAIGPFLLWDFARSDGRFAIAVANERRFGAVARRIGEALRPRRFWQAIAAVRPVLGMAIAASIAAPWYVAVSLRTGGAWPAEFFGVHNLARFLEPMERHGGGWWYYPIALLAGFFPWSCFAAPLIAWFAQREAEETARRKALLGAWVVGMVLPVAAAGTKLPHYVLPAFPALALAVGALTASADPRVVALRRRWAPACGAALAIAGVGTAIGASLVGRLYVPEAEWLGVLGAPAIVAGAAAWRLARRGDSPNANAAYLFAGAGTAAVLFFLAAPNIDRERELERAVALVRRPLDAGAAVGSFHVVQPSLNFYSRSPIQPLHTVELEAFFAESPPGSVVLSTEAALARLPHTLRSRLRVVGDAPLFLKHESIIAVEMPIRTADASPATRPGGR